MILGWMRPRIMTTSRMILYETLQSVTIKRTITRMDCIRFSLMSWHPIKYIINRCKVEPSLVICALLCQVSFWWMLYRSLTLTPDLSKMMPSRVEASILVILWWWKTRAMWPRVRCRSWSSIALKHGHLLFWLSIYFALVPGPAIKIFTVAISG